jgi:glutathione S-transferase
MAEEIILYTNPFSRGRIAHWMLEEVGAPYRLSLVRFDKQDHKQPAFLNLNPMGKVPTIVHRGTVVTEGAAICAYLADAFPEVALAPDPSDPRRGTYLRWLFFGAGCVEPALVDKMFERPIPDRPGALGYGSYADTLRALELAITPGPFVLGDRFSAADVYLGSEIEWGLTAKALEPRPAFTSYIERFSERPSYKRYSAQCMELAAQLNS